jgi:RNA polymerase sigma factor (sigma-70 family)
MPDGAAAAWTRAKAIHRNPESASGGLRTVLLENRSALLRFLIARRVPADEAEDILQDLFVKLEDLKPGPVSQPRAYLYRMAENLLRDRRRSAGWRTSREEAWVAAQLGTTPEGDPRPSAERTLIAREELGLIFSALNRLPDRTLQIFRRYRLDGMRQREIADLMGISVSSVEKHLRRAYQVVVEARERLPAENSPQLRPREEQT